MRVCVPSKSPGGPRSEIAESFEESDLLDIYDQGPDGTFVLTAQIRNCGGMCRDDAETVIRRGANAVIVKSLRPGIRFRLERAGVKVLGPVDGLAETSLMALAAKGLRELPLDKK